MANFVRLRSLLCFGALALTPWAGAAQPPAPDSRAELERQAVEALADGRDARPFLAELAALKASKVRRPTPPRSTVAADLASALERLRLAVAREQGGGSSGAKAAGPDLAGLLAAWDEARAMDLVVRDRFAAVRKRLQDAGAGPVILARLDAAERSYRAASDAILTPLAQPLTEARKAAREKRLVATDTEAQLARALPAVAAALEKGAAARSVAPLRILGASSLPYRPLQLAARTPVTTPTVQPVYLNPQETIPAAADLTGTTEAPLSDDILARARDLAFDPVRIFELVHNGIATEWYAGSMKGAAETLRQGAGNDVDQASLLIALFRASSLPARYVQGVVELPVDALAASLGVPADQVPSALARAGVAYSTVIRGGKLAAVQAEQTWVEVQVPYTNYRGAVVDASGKTWLPLMPAVKTVDDTAPSGLLRTMGLDVDAALTSYLSALQPEDVLSRIRRQALSYLHLQSPDATYERELGSRAVHPETLGILPSSLPAKVVAMTGESAALPAPLGQALHFVLRAGPAETDAAVLDATLPLPVVAGRRVTLSFLPATVDDQRAVDAFGSLDTVPVYLVRVRAQIKVDGRVAATGTGAVAMGGTQRLELGLAGPAGSQTVSETLIAGSYHALAVGAQRAARLTGDGVIADDGEAMAARLLSQEALGYTERWDADERELAGLLAVSVVRPLPSLAVITDEVTVDSVLGLPTDLRWQGVTLDAALRIAEPFTRTGDAAAPRDFLRLSALQGSGLEHEIFEDDFLVDSLSADKGLGLARGAGLSVVTVTSQNAATVVPTLSQPQAVKDDVTNWARLGMTVEVPQTAITRNAWQGSVWRVEDPRTGAAGYFLAGGLAGGATTEPPDSWVLDFLHDALAGPYTKDPDQDGTAGAELVKIEGTDEQTGEVGKQLPTPLSVLVRDAQGSPVVGAQVTFTSVEGGGMLVDVKGGEHTSLTVTADGSGVASALFKLGTRTSDDPVYMDRNPGDQYLTRELVHQVEVTASSAHGAISIDAPFSAFGYPGEPARLRRTDTTRAQFGPFAQVGIFVDSIPVAVEDQYGNPISNDIVTFTVGDMSSFEGCSNPPPHVENAAVFSFDEGNCPANPVLGDCGGPTLTQTSSAEGAIAGVILGNSVVSDYRVDVTSGALPPLSFSYGVVYGQETANGQCEPLSGDVTIQTSTRTDGLGNNFQAVLAGNKLDTPIESTVLYWLADHEVRQDGGGHFYIQEFPQGKWVRTTAEVKLSASNGGSVTDAELVPLPGGTQGGDLPIPGSYRTYFTAGDTPGLSSLQVTAHNVLFVFDAVDSDTGAVHTVRTTSEFFDATVHATDVWGVALQVTGTNPDPLVLTPDSRLSTPASVLYRIDPPQYRSRSAEIDLLVNAEPSGTAVGTSPSGQGSAGIQRGYSFDRHQSNTLRLVLNRGTDFEIKSDELTPNFSQGLFTDVSPSVSISEDVDLVNDRVCTQPAIFHFNLTREAEVTLSVQPIESRDSDGTTSLGPTQQLLSPQVLDAGPHDVDITLDELPPGLYQYTLEGTATDDGHHEKLEGTASSAFSSSDSLPVGHVTVKDVDLFDGNLVISRDDFSLPGRGVPLEFRRSYSLNSADEPGPLGVGWDHNYNSQIRITPCGDVIVSGGDGSGMRFVDDGNHGLRPLRGYHGSLVADTSGHGFDFYSKSGNHFHYGTQVKGIWYLDWISDPNGNKTTLEYGADASQVPHVSAVRDSAGRSLLFHYQDAAFAFWKGQVLTEVDGPGGFVETFEYDTLGNLARAKREPQPGSGGGSDPATPSRSERYEYDTLPDHGLKTRHALVATHDEVRGADTLYSLSFGAVGLVGNVQVPRFYVSQVTEPEGGKTAFELDPALAVGGALQLTSRVTDPRQKTTVYTLNRYGSPLSIADPEHHVTSMEWTPNDVLMTSRTDANNVRTDYTYDTNGNLLTESVAGGGVSYTAETTYWPPSTFDPLYIKDRVQTRKDRNGVPTQLVYDSHGNPTSQSVQVRTVDGGGSAVTVSHTYLPNGDRATTQDPRGGLTSFTYDAYGDLASVTDALHHTTKTDYDDRGRPVHQTDPLGRETLLAYDTLDRLVLKTLPGVQGEPGAPTEATVYDDGARTVTVTDVNGHSTLTAFDRENRPVSIQNAAGGTKELEYDPAGNKTRESTFADGSTPIQNTTFDYSDAGRLIRRTEPLGRVTEDQYDGVGNVLAETLRDAADPGLTPRVTDSTYDGLNRRTRVSRAVDGGPAVTTMQYDGENKVAETDPLGRMTHFRYDELNRLIEMTEPEWKPGSPKTTQRLYDGNGNLIEERHLNAPADQIRHAEYDALNRLTQQTDATGGTRVFEYDAVGNKTREIDPRLDVTSFDYDARNRLVRTTVSLNRVTTPGRQVVTTYTYDALGNRTGESWPNGNAVQHRYDALNRLIGTTDSLGAVASYAYDARGNRVQETDARGSVTTNHFDALDRLGQQDLPENRTVSTTWDAAGNRLSATDARGKTTTYAYDSLNRLVLTTDPAPGSTTLAATYDLAGNKLTETDRRGNITHDDYDALNRLVKVTDPAPLGTSVSYTCDALGNRLTETDRRGIVSERSYDAESRLTRVARADVDLQRIEYDPAGNKSAEIDADGNTTVYAYDERNLLVQESRPLAAITNYTLDDMGDRQSMQDPEGRLTTYEHDARRRLITETNAAHEITRYEYDGNGNRTKQTRPKQTSWIYAYDNANRLTSVTDPLTHAETYQYDGNGNRTAQTDADLHTTTFEYDERNRLTAKVEPGGARWEFGYDGNGNQTSLKDALGQLITMQYDPLNRETLRLYPASPEPGRDSLQSIATQRDGNGNPTQVTEQYSGTAGTRGTQKTYDSFDRLETVTDPQGRRLAYTYDANGDRTSLVDPDGLTTRYAYDALNRVASVTVTGAGVTQYGYYRDSRLQQVKYPNGALANSTYDGAGRLQLLENLENTNTTVSRFAYSFDANGNRTQQVETNGGSAETTTYGFDDADRLTAVTYPDKKVVYTYDGVGNRLTEVTTALPDTVTSSKTFTYGERNRLASLTDGANPSANTTFEYDANGNQTRRLQGGVATDFHYDVRDKLVEVDHAGTLLETYLYDYQGFRVRKSGGDGIVRYVYDDDSVLVQTDDSGNTLAKYDYGPDRLLAMTHVTEGRQFYLFDGLGSITNLVKPDGSLAARYQYDAWGNYRSTAGSSFSIFGFTGHQRDAATGLYYFKARYYDPELGVFLTEDPAAGDANTPPSLHRYLYAYANPTVYVDPDGRITFIKEAKEKLEALAKEGLSSIDEHSSGEEVIKTGLASGLLQAGADVLGGYNFVSNLIASVATPDLKSGQEAKTELNQKVAAVKKAAKDGVKQLQEDYDGTVTRVLYTPDRMVESGLKKGLQAAMGDKRAQADLTAGGTRVGVELLGGEVLGGAGVTEEGFAESGAVLEGRGFSITSVKVNAAELEGSKVTAYFRGTSEGFPGREALQKIQTTPASTDPLVATLFATESSQHGKGVVHIALAEDLEGVEIRPGNVYASLEKEVAVGVTPSEFASRASKTISVQDARAILRSMGIDTPGQIADKARLQGVLKSTPRLTPEQTAEFLSRADKLTKTP